MERKGRGHVLPRLFCFCAFFEAVRVLTFLFPLQENREMKTASSAREGPQVPEGIFGKNYLALSRMT